jgi:hypothetical protein
LLQQLALRDAVSLANNYNILSDEEFEKRSADLSERIILHYCHNIWQPCLKTKRDAQTIEYFCTEDGKPCHQVLIAAEGIATTPRLLLRSVRRVRVGT